MKRFSAGETRAYEISNAFLGVDFRVTPTMKRRVGDLALWLAEGDKSRVRETTQLVLELLSEAARVPLPKLSLKESADKKVRGQKAVWKLYGTCSRDGEITIAFRTAVRKKVFAFRTFLRLVVHEFMHHYDYQHLKLEESFHTSGFYQRVTALYRALLPATARS